MTAGLNLGALFVEKMPYPDPFCREERRTIEEALRVGLRRCFARRPLLLAAPLNEVTITEALETELSSMMEDETEPVPGFTSEVFETIVRGNELCDHSRRHLEKRPDLVLRRKTRPRRGMDHRYFGLFIECKVVDENRTMAEYVVHGLARFVRGEYAWAVPVGMMIAYVDPRTRYELPDTLEKYMRKHADASLKSDVVLRDLPPSSAIYSTTHARAFLYEPEGHPGPIQIDHLWHRAG